VDKSAGQIERTWQAWQDPSAWRYASVGRELPELLRTARWAAAVEEGRQRRQALIEASRAYQLARTWTKRVGEHALSWLAADRAMVCALEADDPGMAAAAAWNLAMILSAKSHTMESREVVRQALDDLRPYIDGVSGRRLAAWGGLHLLGAMEAARDDDSAEAGRMSEIADRVAARTGETDHCRMVFGPTNVAIHRVSVSVGLGRTQDALDLAGRVTVEACPTVERRLSHRVDVALLRPQGKRPGGRSYDPTRASREFGGAGTQRHGPRSAA